ncbi:hypothetical protein [Mesorhizobium sp. SP-1A]|uniref:hypothetical protein n=1 Tax=Mesorhizobium sp. SP-1A TaxID=3077840 RepID=UPI0028F72D33|nr:hypothetical protein [Mesorhizobium sp. SP-1A]
MFNSVVITHPEYGIFVGEGLGLAFWSKLDAVGQNSAAVFENETQARSFVADIAVPVAKQSFSYVQLETEDGYHASIPELQAAGLGDLLGHLGTGENVVGMKVNAEDREANYGQVVRG